MRVGRTRSLRYGCPHACSKEPDRVINCSWGDFIYAHAGLKILRNRQEVNNIEVKRRRIDATRGTLRFVPGLEQGPPAKP